MFQISLKSEAAPRSQESILQVSIQNFKTVWSLIPMIASQCIDDNQCGWRWGERRFISEIVNQNTLENRDGGLFFRPYAGNEDLFGREGDGPARVLVTGPDVGNPIFINRDYLFHRLDNNDHSAFNFDETIRLLVDALGSHHSNISDSVVARVGDNFIELLTERVGFLNLGRFGRSDIFVFIYTDKKGSVFGSTDSNRVTFLNSILESSALCPSFGTRFRVEKIFLNSPSWSSIRRYNGLGQVQEVVFSAIIKYQCRSEENRISNVSATLSLPIPYQTSWDWKENYEVPMRLKTSSLTPEYSEIEIDGARFADGKQN